MIMGGNSNQTCQDTLLVATGVNVVYSKCSSFFIWNVTAAATFNQEDIKSTLIGADKMSHM
jgi:hypothetical protein